MNSATPARRWLPRYPRIYGLGGLLAVAVLTYCAVVFWMDERQSAKYSKEPLARYLSDGEATDFGELFAWLERTFPPGTPGAEVEEFFTSKAKADLEGWWVVPVGLEDLDPSLGEELWWIGAGCMTKGKGYNLTEALKAELDADRRVRCWSGESGALVGYPVKDGRIISVPEKEVEPARSDNGG